MNLLPRLSSLARRSNHARDKLTHRYRARSYQKRAQFVYKATKQHALNLAKFVSIYKTALLFQKTLAGGKQRAADTFFAGLVGGWFVFGDRNAVNEQASSRAKRYAQFMGGGN